MGNTLAQPESKILARKAVAIGIGLAYDHCYGLPILTGKAVEIGDSDGFIRTRGNNMKCLSAFFSLVALMTISVGSALAQGPAIGAPQPADDSSLATEPAVVNHLTMNQWVRVTADGILTGRVFLPSAGGRAEALAEVSVAIMSRDGEVLRAKTDEKGMFQIDNAVPGVYALTARGENVFACCAMHVVAADTQTDVELPEQADIAVANVDYTIVNTAVIRYMPANVKSIDASLTGADLNGLKDRIRGQDVFRVVQTDGGMKGRIHVAGAQKDSLTDAQLTNVFLFKDGMEIDRTLTNQKGNFDFDNIAAGNYSLMAIGPDGIGLIGFELVDPTTQALSANNGVASDGTQLVGFGHLFGGGHQNQCCCEEFAIQVAPCPEVVTCVEEVVSEVVISETIVDEGCGCGVPGEILEGEVVMDGFGTPLGGAGFGPGYGGGGGGFGGGGGGGFGGGFGGLGGLAGLAGIGAIIAATSDDDDNNAITAPIISSPSIPN